MSDVDALFESISPIAERMQDFQRQAVQQYKPVVDDILHSGCRDAKQIEHTLDRLLDFCGYEPVLQLYKRLWTASTRKSGRATFILTGWTGMNVVV